MIAALRLIRIWWQSCRYRLDLLLPDSTPLLLKLCMLPARLHSTQDLNGAVRARLWFESLGPVFVKFGQLLSTRPDLLDEVTAAELKHLQDRVPPFDSQLFRQIVESELGGSVTELFAKYEANPLASASLAQVHGAVLKTGEDVVIKVIRPDIRAVIERDLQLLKILARLVNGMGPDGRRLHAPEVVEDYQFIIKNELNLKHEAANAQKLRDNFLDNPVNYTPKVYWDYVRENIMVSERIDGLAVTDVDAIRAQGTDLKKLAEIGVSIFFTQVFEHNFFHADMHPGNIFVSKTDIENPQYICVDCAITGSLSNSERYALAAMLLGVFDRDYRRVAEVQIQSGWVAADTPLNAFEAEIRTVCEPIFSRPLSEISFADILVDLFQTARRFDMQMIPSLFLLEKTIFNIEGLGRQLYPQLDLWATLAPHLRQWSRKRHSMDNLLKQAKTQNLEWIERTPELPMLIWQALQNSAQPRPDINASSQESKSGNRSYFWLMALLGIVLLSLSLPQLPTPAELRDLGLAVLALSGAYFLVRQ